MLARAALAYLQRYGHLPGAATLQGPHLPTDLEDQFAHGLRSLQALLGLPVTGELSREIAWAIALPRCGRPDTPLALTEAVGAGQFRWVKRKITLGWHSYVNGIPQDVQRDVLLAGARAWLAATPVTADIAGDWQRADIVVQARSLDGPGNVLAQAQLPPGDDRQLTLQFDSRDLFVHGRTPSGMELLFQNVGWHELGHNLGLDHDSTPAQLMNPVYNAQIGTPQGNDLRRITATYPGGPALPPPAAPPPPGAKLYQVLLQSPSPITVMPMA